MFQCNRQDIDQKNVENSNKNCCSTFGRAPLAIAYVPMQQWDKTYKLDIALQKGTIFPELSMPFTGKGV